MHQFAKHFVPNRVQAVYCLIIATLVSFYWCRNRLVYVLTSSTDTTNNDLHAGFVQTLNHATNNNIASFLSLAIFWALVGLITIAIIYESANVVVAAWNDYTIATTYTNAKTFEHGLIRSAIFKALLVVGLIVFAVISWKMFGTWHDLIVQPAHIFFSPSSIVKELAGFAGLTLNIYLAWMCLLLLAPRSRGFFG